MKTRLLTLMSALLLINLQAQVDISFNATQEGTKMTSDLIGAFFEDINYGADGGLYAELVQNRSFEYCIVDGYTSEGPLAHWSLIKEGGANIDFAIENSTPLNSNNTNYIKLSISQIGTQAGLANEGYFGMYLKGGETYSFSAFLKSEGVYSGAVEVCLVDANNNVIVQKTINSVSEEWEKYNLSLSCPNTRDDASLVLNFTAPGVVCADMISLFPDQTFKNRKNGLRKDLAQAIADLNPRFVRFPGGCISHGRGLDNAYRWKETIGKVEERSPNWNLWNYHQTYGLGFYEFFLYCEDIGAKALPVLPIGISCQFRTREIEPIKNMGPWIQDAVDLVEFANGDTSTVWGRKRAEMGHPESFNMKYLCLGNEEDDIPEFRERFIMFQDTLTKYCPEIEIIGTSGTDDTGGYYHSLWDFSTEQELYAVDEHYYNSPEWFLENIHRYDDFDRDGPKVFIGEYASKDDRLYNAICEAAYLTGVEKNADIIQFTCYAPLLNYIEDIPYHWHPDMILFNNQSVAKTANYYVQQLYGVNAGDEYIPSHVSYQASLKEQYSLNGKVGVATWNTQALFDNIKVSSGDKVWIEENFDNTNDWSVNDGTFALNDGRYEQSSVSTPAWSINDIVVDTTNYTITLDVMKTGGDEGFLIPFAYKDANNYYWLNIAGWGNTQHAIEKCINGQKAPIATVGGHINTNEWYTIRIDVSETNMRFYINDEMIFELYPPTGPVTASVVKDTLSNDLILKLVNTSEQVIDATISMPDIELKASAKLTVLNGASNARNTINNPSVVVPVEQTISVSDSFDYQLSGMSMSVIRVNMDGITSVSNPEVEAMGTVYPLNISPNPTKSKALVSLTPFSNVETIKMYDMAGNMVREYSTLNETSLQVERGVLDVGIYILVVKADGKFYSGKLNFIT